MYSNCRILIVYCSTTVTYYRRNIIFGIDFRCWRESPDSCYFILRHERDARASKQSRHKLIELVMKTLLLLLSLSITLVSTAQNAFIYDEYISINHEKGKIQIWDYYNDKLLCKAAPADEMVTGANHGLIGFKKGKKYGLMNFYGKIVVPAIYDAFDYGEYGTPLEFRGSCFAVRKGETIGLIDSTGKFSVPLGDYDYVWDANAGIGAAQKDGLFGLFRNGKNVLPMEYNIDYYYSTDGFQFNRETEVIVKGDLIGLVNNKGVLVQEAKYININDLDDKYWVLRDQDSKEQLADLSGKIILKNKYDQIYDSNGNYIFVGEGNKYGVVRLDGTVACPIAYDALGYEVTSDRMFVKLNSKWGIYNLKTQKQLALDYDNEYSPMWLKTGNAAVQINGLWGMVNMEGKMIVQPAFDNTDMPVFYEDHALVKQNDKYGILSSEGKLILPCIYDNLVPNPYSNQLVASNEKMGLLSKQFEVLIPCEYDEVGYIINEELYLVRNGEKVGMYEIGKGLVVPVEFDEIGGYLGYYSNENFLQTTVNKKIGFVDLSGNKLLPNIADQVFKVNDVEAIIRENDQLKRYSMTTGKEMKLDIDSIVKFETVSFVNTNLKWYCISNSNKKIIGREYSALGKFDQEGRVLAYLESLDYPIALNAKGEEIKPGFHLVSESIFDTILDDDNLESIAAILVKKKLINPMSEYSVVDQMRNNFVIETSDFVLYDEYGYEIEDAKFSVEVYDKKHYFGDEYEFPSEPIYEFTYSDHYSNWSAPNKEGWRWATLKEHPSEDRMPYISHHTVLVNNEGKEIRKENYMPFSSVPFFEHTFNRDALMVVDETGVLSWEMNESLPWEKLGKYTNVIDSVQTYFPTANGLTTEQFIEQYKDSVYISILSGWTYVPEYEEVQTFEYYFYKTAGAQLFMIPPPSEVKYRFVIADPKKMKGGENLPDYGKESADQLNSYEYTDGPQIPYIQAMTMGEKTAYAFGDIGYFVLPQFGEYDSEEYRKETLQSYLKDTAYALIKPYLQQAEHFEKLIEFGIAKEDEYGTPDQKLDEFVSVRRNSLQLYFYPKNLALAMENELLLEPKYLSIASDNSAIGKKGHSTFIAIDSLLNIWRYDLSTRKLVVDKENTLTGITREGIFTQNAKTKLYNFNNFGAQLSGTFDDNIKKVNLIPNMSGIQQLEFTGNCDYSTPIMTVYGEDSIIYHEDGSAEYVYYHFCDTNVMGKYGRFQNGLDLHAYKLSNQPVKLVYNYAPVEQYTLTTTSVNNGIPLNDMRDGEYAIEETAAGLQFMSNNRILELSEKEYLKVRDIPMLSNGYGGIYRKGKFIPYQTLLPFPEKHAVYIHLNKDNYLIGDQKSVELVKLGNDQKLSKSGLFFTSGEDFNEKYGNDFELRYKIQDFVGY